MLIRGIEQGDGRLWKDLITLVGLGDDEEEKIAEQKGIISNRILKDYRIQD